MAYREIGKSAEIKFRSEVESRSREEAATVNMVMKAAVQNSIVIPSYREYLGNSKHPSSIDAAINLPNGVMVALEVDGVPHFWLKEHDREKTKKLLSEGYDYVIRLRAGQLPKLNDGSIEITVKKNGLKKAVETLLAKLNKLAEAEIFDTKKIDDDTIDNKYFYASRDKIWLIKLDLCLKEMKRLHTNYLPVNYVSKDENYPIGRWFHTQRRLARIEELSELRYRECLRNGIDLKEYKNKKKCH